jgi:mono/diheme cytochrome c family protein
MQKMKIFIVILGITALLTACKSSQTTGTPTATAAPPTPTATPTLAATATVSAASTTEATATLTTSNSPTPQSQAVRQQITTGRETYNDDCAQCHGENLQGVSGPALSRSALVSFGTADQLFSFISDQMPLGAAGSLSEQQYENIVAYLLNQDNLLPPGEVISAQDVKTINLKSIATLTPAPAQQATAAPATPAGTVEVELAHVPDLGYYLTDAQGLTLYQYSKDQPGVSNCTDSCAQLFPPLTVAEGTHPIASSDVSGQLGTITRADGSEQITYTNMPQYDHVPLYRYAEDYEPGQINGRRYLEEWDILLINAPSATATPTLSSTTSLASEEKPALGAPIYLESCTPCHGIQGQGVDAPPLRNSTYIQTTGDQAIYDTIANGRPHTEMPAWLQDQGGPLTKSEIVNVIGYLETLQHVPSLPAATPQPPEPTEAPPAPGAPTPEPARPSFPGGPGVAATMTGNIDQGRAQFGLYCAACHGPEGVQGIPNPGSDDGSVPPLNPIDPTLINPDSKIFAANVDLFIEHGSIPEGSSPLILMPAFGDRNMLTQQQIANLIAYVMSLNGVK